MSEFGNNSEVWDARDTDASYIWGYLAHCPEAGTGVSIWVYLQECNGTANIKGKGTLYNSDYSKVTNGDTVEITLNASTLEWRELAFAVAPDLAHQDYIIAYKFSNQVYNHRNAEVGSTCYYDADTYSNAMPDPLVPTTRADMEYCCYVEYTTGAGTPSIFFSPTKMMLSAGLI